LPWRRYGQNVVSFSHLDVDLLAVVILPDMDAKPRHRYIILLEGLAPVKVRFQTFAEDEQEALKQLDNPHLLSMLEKPEVDVPRLKRIKATIKDANTSMIKLVKSF
jgi:hypothetical protein